MLEWARENRESSTDISPMYAAASHNAEAAVLSVLQNEQIWNLVLRRDLDGQKVTVGDRARRYMKIIQDRDDANAVRLLEEGWRFFEYAFAWDFSELIALKPSPVRREVKSSVRRSFWMERLISRKVSFHADLPIHMEMSPSAEHRELFDLTYASRHPYPQIFAFLPSLLLLRTYVYYLGIPHVLWRASGQHNKTSAINDDTFMLKMSHCAPRQRCTYACGDKTSRFYPAWSKNPINPILKSINERVY